MLRWLERVRPRPCCRLGTANQRLQLMLNGREWKLDLLPPNDFDNQPLQPL